MFKLIIATAAATLASVAAVYAGDTISICEVNGLTGRDLEACILMFEGGWF